MPKYKITAPDGNSYFVEGPGSSDEALAHFQSTWKPTPPPAPQSSGITPESVADISGRVGSVAGLAAPFVGAATVGAPLLPVAAELGAAGLAGLATKKILDKTGATQALQSGAEKLRAGIPEPTESDVGHPIFGGTAANFRENLMNEFATPRGLAANALSALPSAAEAAAGAATAPLAGGAVSGIRNLILGKSTVPLAESGNAVLQALEKTHGTPAPGPIKGRLQSLLTGENPLAARQEPVDTGEFRAALEKGRQQLGGIKGLAEQRAMEATQPPEDLPGFLNEAVNKGIIKGQPVGVKGEVAPMFSRDPEASRAILSTVEKAAPQVDNLEKVRALQQQMAGKSAELKKPINAPAGSKVVSPAGDVYGNVADSIKEAINSLIPQPQAGALGKANADFSSFADAQALFQKANTKGQFDPSKAKALWDAIKPERRAKMDPQGHIAALMQTNDPGIIGALGKAVGAVAKLPLRMAGAGNGLGALLNKPSVNAFRFNAPPPPQVPTTALATGGGLAGLLAGQ